AGNLGNQVQVMGRYVTVVGQQSVAVWDVRRLKQIALVDFPDLSRHADPGDASVLTPLAMSPDGNWLVANYLRTHSNGGREPKSKTGSSELLLVSVAQQRVARRLAKAPSSDCIQ